MAELPAELTEAVNQQAQARVEVNIQGYARYLTPEAIDSLRASFPGVPPRVSGYEIANVDQSGADYAVDMRYSNRDASFIVRSKWRKLDEGWMVAHAERLWGEGEKRPGFLSKVAGSILRTLAGLRPRKS